MTKYKDYYETLGVTKDATKKDVRKAYLKLAKKYHPDVNPDKNAEQQFKEVQEAYEVLHDEEKRKKYDQLGENGYRYEDNEQQASHPFRGNDNDFSDFFNQWFGARSNGAAFNEEDLFTNGARRPLVQLDEEANLYITLEDALQGAEMQINIDGRTLKIKIPKAVFNGQKIRLKGQSKRSNHNGKRGDLYINLLLKPHPKFKVEQYNLTAILQIAPWHAALGTQAQIQTLEGTHLNVRIPSGITTGQKMRISKQGLMKENGQRGDLILEIEVIVPKALTDREKELYKQLAQSHSYQPVIK